MTVRNESPPDLLGRILPATTWLRHYRQTWLARDLVGGLAAGCVVLPQAMAYATIANLPAQVGLYTCAVPMLIYALIGGSRTLSVSTTSTVAVLTGSTLLAADVASSGSHPSRDLATLTVLVGMILLVARMLRLGSLVDNISDATLTGIRAGVGLTVAAGQLPKLFGVPGDPDATAFFGEVVGLLDSVDQANPATVALSAVTLAILLVLARLLPRVPAPLIAVGMGIALVSWASIDDHGVKLISPVPSGLPHPVAPSLDHAIDLVGGAVAIALMCFLETAAVAGAVRRRGEPEIDNDQELLANGMACFVGGFFQAMPAAGGFSQTATNQRAGARTQLSGLVTVLLALACALFLGGVLSDLPEATLGCMVIVAVVALIQPAELRRYWRLDKMSFWVAIATTCAGLILGLLAAVLVGVVATLLLVLHDLNTVGVSELQLSSAGDDVLVAGPSTQPLPGLLVLRLDGPLYTANVRHVGRMILAAADKDAPRTLVLDCTALGVWTVTVIDHLGEVEATLAKRGVVLWIAALPPRALATAEMTPQWDELDASRRLYPTALAAVRHYRAVPPSASPNGTG